MDVEEINIALALFMGWKLDNSFPDKGRVYRSPRNYLELDVTFKFHKDWNLLKEVVDKIGSLEFDEYPWLRDYMDLKWGRINIYSTIGEVHQACGEFVEWYNLKK